MANLDALLRIRADVQGANQIVALNRGLQGVERTAAGASMAMRGLEASVGGVIGLVGGATILSKIFGDTATLQTQTRSLEVLLGSAAKASQIVKELQAYGSVTPFESTELIETAKRLGAFGIAGQRLVEVTKRLGDVAGATGSNLGELATAYGQVVAKGRLQTEELLQFQERGVGIQGELQRMYGLSGQELQKALSDGRVSSEAFEQAIVRLTDKGGKYANGAIAQSDTLNGRLSTLRDTVTSLAQTIGGVLEPALSRILLIATNTVDTINRAMRAALLGPQNADTIAQVNAGQLPFGTAGVDKLIGEQRRKALQGQAKQGNFLGFMDQGKFLRLLQQQPEFRSPAGTGGRVAPLTVPPLTSGTRAAGGGGGGGRAAGGGFRLSSQGRALVAAAGKLGVSPLDLATIIGFETGGSYSPSQRGGAGGNYMGLIQFGGPERRQYGANAGQSFEEQVQGPVVRYFQDRFRVAGMSTQGASLEDLYTTVLAGNPRANRNSRDSFGTSPRSGVASMSPHRQEALRRFFGGSMANVGYGPDAAGADMAQGYQEEQRIAQEAAKAAEETAKQLTAARDLLATKEAQLQVAAAMTPLEKLSAEYDQARAERMRDYADKLAAAKSDQERELLVKSQITDWARQELEHKQKLTDLTGQQLTQERERAELLADSMARMQELTSRSSAGAGFQQGLQGYVDSVGNLRDAVGQLTTDSIGGLENSLTELATTGTTNFKAFAASVLQDTSRMIIRQLVLKTIMQIIGGIGGGVAKSFELPFSIPGGNGVDFTKALDMPRLNAMGNVYGADMVNSPTMFKFASGGAFRTGVMGEAGPEAIMPLRRGRDGRLGVAAAGGTSNAITINVDATGTKASGDQGTGAALARDLARVVDDRLIHHRRPGGLLAA